ncbi:MAG: DUF1801 domain-containing protein [Polymorphobacter sp.]
MENTAVIEYLDTLKPGDRAMVDALRALAQAAHPGVTEHIKWNAPSFCVDGDDRITLGLQPKRGVRAVLPRGAKVKDATGFAFVDNAGLATWPTVDRGVLSFKSEAEIAAVAPAITDLFARWLAATT